jgi:hypothetical protein
MSKFDKLIFSIHQVANGIQALREGYKSFKNSYGQGSKDPIKGLVKTVPTPQNAPQNALSESTVEMIDNMVKFICYCHENHGPIDKKYLN